MSSIVFSADLETTQLERGLKSSAKSFDAWVMEQVIKVRKLDDEVKKLSDSIDKAFKDKGTTPAGMFEQWKAKTAELNAETDKLIELQEEQARVNELTENSQQGVIASLIEWGKRLGVVAAATEFFKQVINSTNAAAEEFSFIINGAKGALQQFFQVFNSGAVQGGNPIENMIKGFKGAKELSQAVDQYNDSMRSNTVINSQEIKQLKELETIWRNASSAISEREEALNDWIKIKQAAADRELNIERSLNDALVREIQNRPNLQGITAKQVESFATIYATNPELVKKAEEFWKFSNSAEAAMGPKNVETYERLKKELEALIPIGMTFDDALSAARINASLNDKQINALTDSYKRFYAAQAGGAEVEAQVARWMGSLTNKEGKELEKMSDIQAQIDKQTKLLSEAVKAGNTEEAKAISAKIVLLKEELSVREKLIKAYITAAGVEGIPLPAQAQIPGMPSVIPVTGKNKSWDKLRSEMSSLQEPNKKIIEQNEKRQKGYNKATEESLERQVELREKIAESLAEFVNRLSDALGLDEDTARFLGETMDSIQRAASGDFIGAGLSMLTGVISALPDHAKRFEAEIQKMNDLLKEQSRLVDLASRSGGIELEKKKEVDLALQRYLEVKEAAEYWSDKLDKSIGGIFYGRRKSKAEEFAQLEKESLAFYEDILQEYEDLVAGGVTQNTIADSIARGFQEGKTSVDDFADYLNTILLEAVMAIFSKEILGEEINRLTANIGDYLGDNKLTTEEKEALKKEFQEIAASKEQLWKDLSGALDMGSIGSPDALSGALRKELTEETGSELLGIFRRSADDQRAIKDYSMAGVTHLVNIEKNTFDTVARLDTAIVELKNIASNTKPSYSAAI